MYYFQNDYNQMCHPAIWKHLQKISEEPMPGYGEDPHCRTAVKLIRSKCGREDVAVHFLVGGTQTNLTVIAAALRPHQGVIAAKSAHIHVHKTGAIEATGHKVLDLPSEDGKITAEQISKAAQEHLGDVNFEHTVQPKLVYISQSTELGTTYTLQELEDISFVCKKYGLYLYMDGARLGYALSADENDVTLADLTRLTDVFYIGGTKVGAMFGEAVVISNPSIADDFRYIIKQRGGMMAKGWLIGAQFEALFTDDLYFTIAKNANGLAKRLRETLESLGYPVVGNSKTNQIFTVLPNSALRILQKEFAYSPWGVVDEDHTMVRFCTSWATTQFEVDALCAALMEIAASS